ncbi:aldo/keto reductase [Candidatus Sumerlaeota bacterium]|nr:aldo/keto reductase [Candidatus Sumerlaeota bacterium]
MIYTKLGKTGLEVSRLSFGVMRLPEKDDKDGKRIIDRESSIPLLRKGAELGINFYDTHPFYCMHQSEIVLGEALKGIKEKVHIQTKCPLWKELEPGETWSNRLEQSLRNLQRDYIDLYIAHSVSWETFEKKGRDFLRMAAKAREEGLIGHTGFSSHDKPENVMKLLDVDEFECMTIQYNLRDLQYARCIEKAAKKGMGVIIMGPVGGGILEKLPKGKEHIKPEKVGGVPEMALRYVFRNPGVSCALSGMSSMEQLEENIRTISSPDPLTEKDYLELEKSFFSLKELADLYCTRCGYCQPCPQNINIPGIFHAVNLWRIYGSEEQARFFYGMFTHPDKEGKKRDPSVCIECGECEKKCPQHIPIIEQLKEAQELFGKPE